MKKIRLLLILIVFIGLMLVAIAYKKDNTFNVVKFTTIGKYLKPGAAVDISYESQQVATDEVANIKVRLNSSLNTGDMLVAITLDEALIEENIVEKELRYQLNGQNNEYTINLNVSSQSNGVFYIRLFIQIEGGRSRAFAVPVYVGNQNIQKKSLQATQKNSNGEKISISKAEERITVLD